MVLAALFTTVAEAQSVPPLAYVQPMPPPAVQAVQEHLRTAGAYSGPADGVWGPDSAAALQRFQAAHQLQVTGQLNQATAASLGLDPVTLLGAQQAALASPALSVRAMALAQSRTRAISLDSSEKLEPVLRARYYWQWFGCYYHR